MKFKKLLLFETIASVRKLYPKIDDQDFNRLIRLDPTFNPTRDSVGTYGKWILNLFNKHSLDNEGHVTDLLRRFEEAKPQLKIKDINRFKTPVDLEDYLNDEENYNELTDRQQLRKTQNAVQKTDITKDATKVYEDAYWTVWTPHTYEASCKLGQGTKWCTATTNSDYYYNYYSKQGPLYILIDKDDPDIKYQFHFESDQFMDADDESIDPFEDMFEADADLREFFRPQILKHWDLPSNINFDDNITINIFDGDFYKILNDMEPYYSHHGDAIKGKYIYDILYSPHDYFDDSYYSLTKDDFDSFIEYEIDDDQKEKLTAMLDGELTYDSLMEHIVLFEQIEDALRTAKSEYEIKHAQEVVMSEIENVFRNEIDCVWRTSESQGYYLELSGPITDFMQFGEYGYDTTLHLDNKLKTSVGNKIRDDLRVYHSQLETYGVDYETLDEYLTYILD